MSHPLSLLLTLSLTNGVEDHHQRPDGLAPPTLNPTLQASVEYPLAVQFIPAHATNYVVKGMQEHRYVIIHTMEGTYPGTISWFQYSGSNVSTHYVMRAIDGEITQMVSHDDMAQHIGGWNPRSFGIEHEGFIYEPGWYTWETYVASAQLTRWLCDHYDIPIDREHIVGHVEVPGAAHTDPGPYWNWGMYMALVHDVVPAGRVEGVVVDRTQACEITATADNWITTTLETLDALDDDEVCFVPAGTKLSYLHASGDMISQRRLHMDGGGPCAGIGELDSVAFVYAPSYTELCPPDVLAAHQGVTVHLDGQSLPVDTEGRFVFEGVPAGPHTLEVHTDGHYHGTMVPIDVEVYPGNRVVIGLDPNPDGSSSDGGGDEGGDEGSSGSATGEDDTSIPDEETTSSDPRGESSNALPTDIDTDEASGCGCTTTPQPGRDALLLALFAFTIAHRRRSTSKG